MYSSFVLSFQLRNVVPDNSLRHGQGRIRADDDGVSGVKDVERNSSISNEGVTHLALADAFPARVRLKSQVGDGRQVQLSSLGSLAPEVLEAVDAQGLAGF